MKTKPIFIYLKQTPREKQNYFTKEFFYVFVISIQLDDDVFSISFA